MNACQFDVSLAEAYKSPSQRIRVMSEGWMARNMYCPCCGNAVIRRYENNRPVADFFCEQCGEDFELKSKNGPIGQKIVDGAYETAVNRIAGNGNPSLFVLQYRQLQVVHLTLVPKFFFTPSLIEKRKPLPPTARRSGWVGANILYQQIPDQGRITIIQDSAFRNREDVLNAYAASKALYVRDTSQRGWLMDVLQCVNAMPGQDFTLQEMYRFGDELAAKHPENHNVQAKIRQQLQMLRDKGVILFLGNGRYRKRSGAE